MYESPINKIVTELIKEEEEMVMKAIRKVEIYVDRNELIKALKYDRKQYIRGYKDGRNDVLEEMKAEITEIAGIHHTDCVIDIINKYLLDSENITED